MGFDRLPKLHLMVDEHFDSLPVKLALRITTNAPARWSPHIYMVSFDQNMIMLVSIKAD
jgi:hypothetical protein